MKIQTHPLRLLALAGAAVFAFFHPASLQAQTNAKFSNVTFTFPAQSTTSTPMLADLSNGFADPQDVMLDNAGITAGLDNAGITAGLKFATWAGGALVVLAGTGLTLRRGLRRRRRRVAIWFS